MSSIVYVQNAGLPTSCSEAVALSTSSILLVSFRFMICKQHETLSSIKGCRSKDFSSAESLKPTSIVRSSSPAAVASSTRLVAAAARLCRGKAIVHICTAFMKKCGREPCLCLQQVFFKLLPTLLHALNLFLGLAQCFLHSQLLRPYVGLHIFHSAAMGLEQIFFQCFQLVVVSFCPLLDLVRLKLCFFFL